MLYMSLHMHILFGVLQVVLLWGWTVLTVHDNLAEHGSGSNPHAPQIATAMVEGATGVGRRGTTMWTSAQSTASRGERRR